METQPTDQLAKRPLLNPERKADYLKALNELVGCLSLNESRPVPVDDFCARYNFKPSFFDALRDLDALEMDFSKPCTDSIISFTKCEKLMLLQPEDVLMQMRRNAHKTAKSRNPDLVESEPEELSESTSAKESIEQKAVRPAATAVTPRAERPRLATKPVREAEPADTANLPDGAMYTIKVFSPDFGLRLNVSTPSQATMAIKMLELVNNSF